MTEKLTVINYETLDYARQRASDIMQDLGIDTGNIIRTDTINNRAIGTSLFGDKTGTVITVTDKKEVPVINDTLKEYGDSAIGDGMVILFSLRETLKPVKELLALTKKLKGKYECPKKNSDGEITSIIDSVKLNPQSREFLLSYVGNDYTLLLPIVKGLQSLTPLEQSTLTIQDLIIRLPDNPGETTIWGDWRKKQEGLDDLILSRNRGAALKKLERILDGGTPELVVLAFLKNRFKNMFRLKTMLACGVDQSTAANALKLPDPKYSRKGQKDPVTGKNGYPTVKLIQSLRNIDTNNLIYDMNLFIMYEEVMKGRHPDVKLDSSNVLYGLISSIRI